MLYLIVLLLLMFFTQQFTLLPQFSFPEGSNKIKSEVKNRGIALGVLIVVLLGCTYYFDFKGFKSSHVWAVMTLIGVIIYSIYSNIILMIKNNMLLKEYQKLKVLKHGDKDVLNKLKGEIENEKRDLLTIKTEIQEKRQDLEDLDHNLSLRETELNDESRELQLLQLDSKDKIDSEIQRQRLNLEKEFHDKLINEKSLLQESYNRKLQEHTERLTLKMEERIRVEKSSMVDNLFEFDGIDRDDLFELNKSKEEIEKSKLHLELDKKVMEAKEYVLDAKKSALEVKSENVEIKAEMKVLASDFKMDLLKEQTDRVRGQDEILHKLELEQERRIMDSIDIKRHLELLQEKNKTKFLELQHYFESQLKDLQIETREVFLKVKESMSDMKLEFGKDILRLDGQHQTIMTELEKYYNKSREYVHQCQSLAIEARSQNLEGGMMLDQVNTMYKQHRMDTKEVVLNLNHSLNKLDLKEGEFANSVNSALLRLESNNESNQLALRDIALERKGLDVAYKTKEQEQKLNLQEIRHQRKDLDRSQKQYRLEQSNREADWQADIAHDRMSLQNQRDKFNYAVSLDRAQSNQRYLSKYR